MWKEADFCEHWHSIFGTAMLKTSKQWNETFSREILFACFSVWCVNLYLCLLQSEPGLVDSYEAVVRAGCNARITSNVCIIDMFAALNNKYISFRDR